MSRLKILLEIAEKNGPKGILEYQRQNPGIDINAIEDGWTPLTYALSFAQVNAAKSLLEAGADPNTSDLHCSPLYRAVQTNEPDLVTLLLEKGAKINETKNVSLIQAFTLKNAKICKILIEAGASLMDKNHEGNTILSLAIEQGFNSLIPLIAKSLKDKNTKHWNELLTTTDNEQHTPLSKAVLRNNFEAVEHLISLGADVNQISGSLSQTPLHVAASINSAPMIKLLLEQGAGKSLEVQDSDGETPLMSSLTQLKNHVEEGAKKAEAARSLLSAGANVNACDKHGYTVLHLAAKNNIASIIPALLEKGANKTLDDCDPKKNETPLLLASRLDNVDAAQALIQCGASLTTLDKMGHNALYWAEFNDSSELMKLLGSKKTFPEKKQEKDTRSQSSELSQVLFTLDKASGLKDSHSDLQRRIMARSLTPSPSPSSQIKRNSGKKPSNKGGSRSNPGPSSKRKK